MKSGKINFLEPSGPLQACNGAALPLPLVLVTFLRTWYVKSHDLHLSLELRSKHSRPLELYIAGDVTKQSDTKFDGT